MMYSEFSAETTWAFSSNVPLFEQIQLLEDAYADALADGCDRQTLTALFDRIKELREQLPTQAGYRHSIY
jgi:hypothetical protein